MSDITTDDIDTSDVEPWKIFQALFNHTHQQGLGVIDGSGAVDMTDEQAQADFGASVPVPLGLGCVGVRFDYHRGRVMKILILTGDDRTYTPDDFRLYDRDNYQGAARDAILSVVPDPANA